MAHMISSAPQQPYAGQYDPYASPTTYSNSGANYPPSKSSTLGYNNHPYYRPTDSPSQLTSRPTNDSPYGGIQTYPAQQGPPFGYNGPYNTTGDLLRRERSPSPTPSEIEAMKRPIIDWKVVFNWRTYTVVKYIPYYIAFIVTCVLVILMSVYHKEIVNWLKPAADWMHNIPFGWIIPIVVLIVLSFPPLFGHEIVGVLCGVVWGLWVGFLIMCAGTLLGEICTYYVFKYLCRTRGEKLEKTKASYACLARVVRDGGFKVCLMARLSALPGHFTTAIFATCGMNIFVFTLAAFLSLPKQFITVYLGVMLEHANDSEEEKQKAKKSRLISNIVLVITFIITVASMWWIWRQMVKVRPTILRERRIAKKRATALTPAGGAPPVNRSTTELDSILDHTPVKENEGGWGHGGGHGYSGIGQNSPSIPYNGSSREEWAPSNSRLEPYSYQPQSRGHIEVSGVMTPTFEQAGSHSSRVVHRQGQSIDNNGTNAYLQSESYQQTPTQQTFSPQQQWQPPASPPASQPPEDPSPPPRKVDTNAPSTGLHTFGVTLTDPGPTKPKVSVNTAHVSKRSVEMRSGHAIGRSFRASIEEYSPHQ